MTRRINQKLAQKRKHNDQHLAEKEVKKARKADVVQTTSCLVVEQLVGGSSLALPALASLAMCGGGGGEEDPPDQMDEFFAGGGQASHVLHVLDTNQEKNKANDVAAVFNTVEAVVTRVVRGKDRLGDRCGEVAMELVKRVNSDYGKEIVLLLSGTNTAYQAKSVLRMLTAMVTLGPTQAREVLMKVNWEHDNWDTLSKRSSKKDPPDVRTCFIHFLLSFLFEPSPLVLKDFFSMKTRLASLFPGLMQDQAETVMLVLETLRSKVLENPAVSKTQKMKVFGSHNIKPLLALLKWTGPKKSEGTEGDDEEKEAVQESVTAFLKVLLGSTKHGVVFPDPSAGQGEKNLNHLAKEVLLSQAKPWESVSLSSVMVELVTACPDQLPALLGVLGENWEPRDSPSWHLVMDLILAVMEQQDSKSIGAGMNAEISVGKVVENVILPHKLVEKVVSVGLEMESMVSTKCLELLEMLVKNLEQFLANLSGPMLISAKAAVKNVLTHFQLASLWGSLTGYMTKGQTEQVMSILRVTNFVVGRFDVACDLDVGQVLKEVELNKERLGDKLKEVQLSALKLFSSITNSSASLQTSSSFLAKLCTEDTLLMLLENIADCEGQEKVSSTEILSGLVKSSGVCLETGLDLGLMVALVDRENCALMATVLLEAIDGKKEMVEKVLALKFQEVCLRNQNQLGHSELFEALMSPDFAPSMVASFLPSSSCEEMFSPLILSMVGNHSKNTAFIESFFRRLVFLFQDVDIFSKQLQSLVEKFSSEFQMFLTSVLSPSSSSLPTPSPSTSSWFLSLSILVQMLHFPSTSPADMTTLVNNLPTDMQAGLVRLAVQRLGRLNRFNPYVSNNNVKSSMVLAVLKLAHKLQIQTQEIQTQFGQASQQFLSSVQPDQPDHDQLDQPDLAQLSDSFTLLPLPSSCLHQLASCLAQLPTNMFCKGEDGNTTTLTTILMGVWQGLSSLSQSDLSDPTLVTMVAKLSCLVEVLLDTQCDLQELSVYLAKMVSTSPAICSALSSNLVVVLVKSGRIDNLSLAECLVKLDKKHLDAFKVWVCQEKHLVTEKLWPIVRVVLQSQEFESEKKFITILLKRVVNQVEEIFTGSSECEEDLLEMVSLLSRYSTSDKQLELWKKAVGVKMDSVDDCLKASANAVLLKYRMLVTVQKKSGGFDSRLMRECFLPLLHQISSCIKMGDTMGDMVINLCSAAKECKEVVENKIFVKEIGKNSSLWQKFFRSVLKYSLKVGACGVAALNLLGAVSGFLLAGSKLPEAADILEMVTSHSLYLGTLLGPGTTTKTALIHLMMSLSPLSCTMEQIPLLLSGYTATMHPSDRAILTFLSMHEKAGLDLSQFQPFMFGPAAVKHYAVMAGGAWKQPKVSEVLSMLDKDIMRKSCISFPISLPLDPQADVEDGGCPDTTIYDPRFILPFLSQLMAPEMYMDKHMRLVDSGALSYAIASLSSREWGVRAAGYHVLARVVGAMDTAKLAQEKQVWLHILSLIRNGLATGSNTPRCARLSSLVTVFLVRVVDILLTPLSTLYKTVSRSILAKPAIDLQAVPEFSRLLNSADLNSTGEQRWVLEVVRDGMRDNLDYSLANRSFVCKILKSQWGSVAIDRVGHLQILDILERCVATNYGCTDLVTRHGLLTWLVAIIKQDRVDKLYIKKVVNIVKISWETICSIEERKQDEKKGLLTKLIQTEMKILLGQLQVTAERKQDAELRANIENISSSLDLISTSASQ